MKTLHIVAFTLTIIGSLNWGLIGLLNINLISLLLGDGSGLERIVYVLYGVSAVYIAAIHMNTCSVCKK